jgi:hypothetical protein
MPDELADGVAYLTVRSVMADVERWLCEEFIGLWSECPAGLP